MFESDSHIHSIGDYGSFTPCGLRNVRVTEELKWITCADCLRIEDQYLEEMTDF